ncbi:MAG: hypothetical protein LBN24_10560 [Mediterranea sp.]|jgi:ADP-ribose pyrophosphatase YjhB (NUDIX family)|nr:hypothetical protein [Mediterranea sp.]
MKEYFPYNAENIHPGFSIDCVILSYHKRKIYVLLNKFYLDGYWALPGGFMFANEDADSAAYRILKMRTGLSDIYLRQFHLFSDPKRTEMNQHLDFSRLEAQMGSQIMWIMRRFVTMGYYALVRYDDIELVSHDNEQPGWYEVDKLPSMYSDHANIIRTAITTLRELWEYFPLGEKLLPEQFTISNLRNIYEFMLEKKLDRRNFQRKMLTDGVIQEVGRKEGVRYNAPVLYSFINKKI